MVVDSAPITAHAGGSPAVGWCAVRVDAVVDRHQKKAVAFSSKGKYSGVLACAIVSTAPQL